VEYIDVTKDSSMKEEMIKISGGKLVPVIVEAGEVKIGHGGT
jgi:glutaredoxin